MLLSQIVDIRLESLDLGIKLTGVSCSHLELRKLVLYVERKSLLLVNNRLCLGNTRKYLLVIDLGEHLSLERRNLVAHVNLALEIESFIMQILLCLACKERDGTSLGLGSIALLQTVERAVAVAVVSVDSSSP